MHLLPHRNFSIKTNYAKDAIYKRLINNNKYQQVIPLAIKIKDSKYIIKSNNYTFINK